MRPQDDLRAPARPAARTHLRRAVRAAPLLPRRARASTRWRRAPSSTATLGWTRAQARGRRSSSRRSKGLESQVSPRQVDLVAPPIAPARRADARPRSARRRGGRGTRPGRYARARDRPLGRRGLAERHRHPGHARRTAGTARPSSASVRRRSPSTSWGRAGPTTARGPRCPRRRPASSSRRSPPARDVELTILLSAYCPTPARSRSRGSTWSARRSTRARPRAPRSASAASTGRSSRPRRRSSACAAAPGTEPAGRPLLEPRPSTGARTPGRGVGLSAARASRRVRSGRTAR